ncbi:MAG TPA: MlaD family protein [Burkholderiaceae bacterium]|nr:MlaD family protein [Burkholderiaceae bacterium]
MNASPSPPSPVVRRKRRFGLSLVWLVPIVAVIAGASLIARSFMQQGPAITIEFRTAEGIEPGKTEVRYKEVVVGRVERVRVGPTRQNVLVDVQLSANTADVAVEDTHFWVVRPRIGTTGVSGLGTLLSGAYIGMDAGSSATERRHFVGLEAPPLVLRGEPGRSFVLHTNDLGSLDIGSPVYYRRVRVGRVVGFTLDPNGDRVLVQVFIEAPHERLVGASTRFWTSTGIEFSFDAKGVAVNTQSLATLLGGGIAFSNPETVTEQRPITEGSEFTLFPNEKAALAPPDGDPVRIRMRFAQSMRGLAVDAPIEFVGIEIGQVRGIALQYDAKNHRFPAEVDADIYPTRLGAVVSELQRQAKPNANTPADIIGALVANGLRAQLRTGNVLSGQMYVALDFVSDTKKAAFDPRAAVLEIPTVPSPLSDLQPQIANIVASISKVPFDAIGRDLQRMLAASNAAIERLTPEAQHTLQDVRRTLDEVQRNLTAPDASLQRNANQALQDLQRAARSMRVLADYLQRHPESLLRGNAADAPPPAQEEPAR